MNNEHVTIPPHSLDAIDDLWNALAVVNSLGDPSAERDALWLSLWRAVTTRSDQWAAPIGSAVRVRVSDEHADAELISAWQWLTRHEVDARSMAPFELFVKLRGVATRSAQGSARAAIADSMHGVTGVPAGTWLTFGGSDVLDRVA